MEDASFEPDVQLEYGERSHLAAWAAMPGHQIYHRLARAEVHKFIVHLINADSANREEIYSRHLLSKAAAQFYEGLTKRVNNEVYQYTAAPRASDKPVDATENVLDIGEIAERFENFPNLLSEEAGDLYE